MILISTPPWSHLGSGLDKPTSLTLARLISTALTLPFASSPDLRQLSTSLPPKPFILSSKPPTATMSELPDTPRSSSCFSPTLDCIPEVFEYEELDGLGEPTTPNDIPESTEVLLPERSTVASPKLSRRTAKATIIQSRARRPISISAISKGLRKVLDADRMRRSRIMKVYLKAILFIKYLWAANERYGAVMLTSGMYVPR